MKPFQQSPLRLPHLNSSSVTIALFTGVFLLLSGCTKTKYAALRQKEYDAAVSKKPPTPPGTVWLRDNLYFDETEVSNFHYTEYIFSIQRTHPEQYKETLPDTLVWRDMYAYFEPFVFYYLKHPAYRDFPVVGVSYKQALDYCGWRTKIVNQWLYLLDHKKVSPFALDTMEIEQKVRYRLPTKEEWEYAAQAGLDGKKYTLGYEHLVSKKGEPANNTMEYFNLYRNDQTEHSLPRYINTGTSNPYGYYELQGNVSEMVADSLIKGLSYLHYMDGRMDTHVQDTFSWTNVGDGYPKQYTLRSYAAYTKPTRWLGFRCICEVLK